MAFFEKKTTKFEGSGGLKKTKALFFSRICP
jgi:hypothetical protein